MPYVRHPTDTTRLQELLAAAHDAEQAVVDEVARLRQEESASWSDIAEAEGTSRQNAFRKYGRYRWNPTKKRAESD
jgi:uncharacterized protein with PIN domain